MMKNAYLWIGAAALGVYMLYQRGQQAEAAAPGANGNGNGATGTWLDNLYDWIPAGSTGGSLNTGGTGGASPATPPATARAARPAGLGQVIGSYVSVYAPKVKCGRAAPPGFPAAQVCVPGLKWVRVKGRARRPDQEPPAGRAWRREVVRSTNGNYYFRWYLVPPGRGELAA